MNFCFIRSPYRKNRNLNCISLYFVKTKNTNHILFILIFYIN